MTYKRALITGGAGLIGSHIADRLVAEGFEEIVVLDNLTRGRRQNLEPATGVRQGHDRRRRHPRCQPGPSRAMEGIDIVFHRGGDPHHALRGRPAAGPRRARDRHVQRPRGGGRRQGQARRVGLVRLDLRPGRGVSDRPKSTTATATARSTARPRSTARGCCAASTRCTDSNYVALRYFNVYGPRMDAFGVYTEVMIRWMERLAKGQPCLILGDGAQTMDFVFVTDIARANLWRAALVDHRRRAQCRERHRDQPDRARRALGRVMGVDLPPEYGRPGRPRRSGGGSPTCKGGAPDRLQGEGVARGGSPPAGAVVVQ